MSYLATLTSKRQFTIPSEVFKKADFKEGEKVIVEEENGTLRIKKASALVEELAGSVKVPRRFRGMDADEIIRIAKEEYFKNKRV